MAQEALACLPFSRMKPLPCALLLAASAFTLPAAKNLEVISIDVEGGQSTLFVSPSGESMLVDTGYGPRVQRARCQSDRSRGQDGGRKENPDYLVITHYHADHVGAGVAESRAQNARIVNFVDHGPNEAKPTRPHTIRYTEYLAFPR